MRNLLGLALAITLTLWLSGCGKKPKMEAPTRTAATDTKALEGSGEKPADETTPVFSGQSQRFAAVYFDFDKYNLRNDAKDVLRRNAALLKQNQNLRITVEGHCDERGTVEYNLALGEKRAKSVRDYLASLGINSGRLEVISYGKERPAVDGHNENAWSKNRRAEFVEK
jgi:peptidoglycan-associated lipoprotein